MLSDDQIDLIRTARHGDPFAVLGVHEDGTGVSWLRVFLPGASHVVAVTAEGGATIAPLLLRHRDGLFEAPLGAAWPAYRLQVHWADGNTALIDDPYRFPPVLGEMDVWLMGEGTHLRPYEVLGAREREMLGVQGTSFAVWAPNASRVSVVGDFNHWDGRRHPMRLRRECGVWEIFLPGVLIGARYKYEICTRDGQVLPLKADPYALQGELRPATASVVAPMPEALPFSHARQKANALDAPMSIYEVHLGSWRRKPEEGNRWLDWDELAATLVPYAREMGFTHLELLPVSEHPFDGSWGYQPLGLFAPTARFGDPAGFGRFVQRCHDEGLGLLLDWVPAHFPSDSHGLAQFDGTALYEYADPREGFHQDWNTLIYNFGRTEVRNFLVGNALFWLERYGVDGLRVDAVASMLYRDYSRNAGEWIPNAHGGRENLEAIAFLRRLNEVVGVERPQAVTLAEESTAFPAVSRPTYAGRPGIPLQVEHGLDARHAEVHRARPDPPPVPPRRADLRPGLCLQRELRAAASRTTRWCTARARCWPRCRATAGRSSPTCARTSASCSATRARSCSSWAASSRRSASGTTNTAWTGTCSATAPHAGMQRLVHDLNRLYRDTPALYQRDFDGCGFRMDRP